MTYARYIGRVGALAVALGIGTAIGQGCAVASADDSGTASSHSATHAGPGRKADGKRSTRAHAAGGSQRPAAGWARASTLTYHLPASSVATTGAATLAGPVAVTRVASAATLVESELALLGLSRRTEADTDEAGTTHGSITSSATQAASSGAAASPDPITAVAVVTATSGSTVTGQILATSARGLPLNYSVLAAPTGGATVALDDRTGEFIYTPGDSGENTVQFTALVVEQSPLASALENAPLVGQLVSKVVATLQQTPVLKTILAPLIGHALQVPVNIDTGETNSTTLFAPYVDMALYPQFDFTAAVRTGGIHTFTLGFINSDPHNPGTPSWEGYYSLDSDWAKTAFSELAAAGADGIISFGGAGEQELAQTISDSTKLAATYQSVMDTYRIYTIDFDIEGAALLDAASITRRAEAIAQLQADGSANGNAVTVSFTLPVAPTGLDADGLAVVQSAIDAGVDIKVVNVMAMSYFDPTYSPYHMGDLAIEAAQSVYNQLAVLYPKKSESELWAMIGLTPMIGYGDDTAEIFTLSDAADVVSFADHYGLGRLAMWSANRDAQCTNPRGQPQNTCSGVTQTTWEFSSVFEQVEATNPHLAANLRT